MAPVAVHRAGARLAHHAQDLRLERESHMVVHPVELVDRLVVELRQGTGVGLQAVRLADRQPVDLIDDLALAFAPGVRVRQHALTIHLFGQLAGDPRNAAVVGGQVLGELHGAPFVR